MCEYRVARYQMKVLYSCGWDDVPHLTESMKQSMEEGMLPHLKEARRHGKPTLGSGAIYPVPEDDIIYDKIELDPFWLQGAGMDVGWKKNAVVWARYDSGSDIIYLHDEYYRGYAEPSVHASAVLARSKEMPIMIDTGAHSSSQFDGVNLFQKYCNLGLNLINANKAVDAGLLEVFQRLSSGRLKIHKNLVNWLKEFRIYRRNEKGQIVKENDHLMDATRYLVMGLGNFRQISVEEYRKKHQRQPDMCEMDYSIFE